MKVGEPGKMEDEGFIDVRADSVMLNLIHGRILDDSGLATGRSMNSFSNHLPLENVESPSRSDGEAENRQSSEYYHDVSDVDSGNAIARHEFYCKSVGTSSSDSPSRINFSPHRAGHSVQSGQEGSPMLMSENKGPFDQETMAVSRRSDDPEYTDDYSDESLILRHQKLLDFENNGLIWFPPPPDDENDEADSNFFSYDDEDDDIGDSGAMFSSSSSLSSMFPAKEKQNEGNKEPLRIVVQGHFRALVSQLLQGEGIKVSKEESIEDWLDILTTIAWQAANYVRPDTSKGGSMDPGDYVKVKCIAAGSRTDSALVRGVVCTKNIKHKRMTTQYKNPRLLLLGGALEYQSVSNQLASFNTLMQQETDHLKMIMSKIEALRPNVLLVEKTVSPRAQEYLLAKEISLVLNVKRPLMERIACCTGALISPSIDSISTTRLGHCELFRLEKVSEEHENPNQLNKKMSKTLMFFEGCTRRLGCTVLLRGACREELKKLKHVVQYAVFAAYHLSLETSFLADEGATLPKMTIRHSITLPEKTTADNSISIIPATIAARNYQVAEASAHDEGIVCHGGSELFSECLDLGNCRVGDVMFDAHGDELAYDVAWHSSSLNQGKELKDSALPFQGERQVKAIHEQTRSDRTEEGEASGEYFTSTDNHQSLLVYFSSRCVLKASVCERSRLLRIKFYGCFDKPLGRYLRDDLFNQTSCCQSCKEPVDAHVLCYTHQQGNLTINVRRLSSIKLPGERDGRIWMWHRCLRCAHIDGVPPATCRVVMSDDAWGLSFGKFLELSFSNHATANRVAPCGHSLQRDCLRYYGFGSMVAFFRYSPIDILSVYLPPSVLEFNLIQQEWTRKEAAELTHEMETFYVELSCMLDSMEQRSRCIGHESSDMSEIHNHIMELKDMLKKEKSDYYGLLQHAVMDTLQLDQTATDILELNRLRRELLIGSHVWDRQLYTLDSLLQTNYGFLGMGVDASHAQLKELSDSLCKDDKLNYGNEENVSTATKFYSSPENDVEPEVKDASLKPFEPSTVEDLRLPSSELVREKEVHLDGEIAGGNRLLENALSDASILSEKIDSAWTGTELSTKVQLAQAHQVEGLQVSSVRQLSQNDNPSFKRVMSPMRFHSFDSAVRLKERINKGLPPSLLHLSAVRSFHASGEYRTMLRDPVSSVMRSYSQALPLEVQKLNSLPSSNPSFITSVSNLAGGARLLLPKRSNNDIVVAVYDNDPASIVSYALSSKEYEDWVADRSNERDGKWSTDESFKEDSAFSAWQSFGSLDVDYIRYGSYASEDTSSMSMLFMESKKSPHLTVSFADESTIAGGKAKFSVTCYFAKQFDSLRKKCCPSDVDFVRSLSRCQRWSAEGGKSNVYFAKSLDERFIIKQVKKTELESFEEFAPEYFKYLMHSLSSGSPTCLAKVIGIYQVTVKHLKGGKETKMDLMVMENLFFRRNVTRIYDLKGSARARYNPDTTGANRVLLDMNLVETLRTEPIFLGSKAKRSLERAIWNDTSFLTSVDVMDYSLLVGVDEDRKELVLGIIDFMRQYTWDKHLETWVKASGILGGPKNASPTIISPKQYKKRFRKAMTSYFLTVPEQWSS
ncbi:putative 1-phosphatidylinositol-3-phosphate 5-kinase FAB1C isoform X2 [Tripterygium wilfordii]|uniref:putative 1-phosphatidylinositol-3-phosphate 5-kinase FAB1C isoform X2 n=2 Tax=Tripterygium wilfordii TaxID=458696 RepID=UPI0018F814C5|nr:putative 1-phosphatidylinositol-3-phosphate 5-kinase FAB1C isoform X2 [Tripterygium wilfordii]